MFIKNAIFVENKFRNILRIFLDCYEQLAVGYQLHSKDVYKSISPKSFEDCKSLCSEDGFKCMSFSFG